MVADVVIRAEGLGKKYLLAHLRQERERYTALRDVIARNVRAMLQRLTPGARDPKVKGGDTLEEFWALKNVDFEIRRGDVVGIIGRNGAGKSTLLKILSRITEPSEGRVTLKGRVASLLEVGTGFHPELTGRENVYLNGAVLGMSRAEIRRKFDEIVAFAEVEQFLDTPVKRYSSGMYVRLAFAVAAHLEPEILIVDEVLAVGDAEFQKKCLGKLGEVSKGGRTVLFVSHQMAAIQNLCETGILLAQGQILAAGPISAVVRRYISDSASNAQVGLENRIDRQGSGALHFAWLSLADGSGNPVQHFTSGEAGQLEIRLAEGRTKVLRNVRFSVGVDNDLGQRVLVLSTHFSGRDFVELPVHKNSVVVQMPVVALVPGRYTFTLFCSVNGEVADWVKEAGSFEVEAGDFYGSGQLPAKDQGIMLMDHRFDLNESAEVLIANPLRALHQ